MRILAGRDHTCSSTRIEDHSVTAFGDRLAAAVAARESQIVLGLDPDPLQLWPGMDERGAELPPGAIPAARAAVAVREHCFALIEAAGPACVAVKPQLARFELLGVAGREALAEVVTHAHETGLLVIADCKRGDIDVTATAYARSLQGSLDTPHGLVEGLHADLVTVNPLMGTDAIEPFVATARLAHAGVLVLVRTSNPGAADIQDLELADGGVVWERIALLAQKLGSGGVGECGLSDVGAVMGATVPAHLERVRDLMPNAIFLLPGVGAQGGRVEDLAAAFAPGRAAGLITASRSIANAYLAASGPQGAAGSPHEAARAEAERLRELAWGLYVR